jgi:flagellar protein FliO/FliZ
MTWMIIRLILSLAFVAAVLLFAARLAKKRGLGQGSGVIEVVARQRMGRSSTVNVVRIADVVLVVGATEQQITLLAEVDAETVEQALAERRAPGRRARPSQHDTADDDRGYDGYDGYDSDDHEGPYDGHDEGRYEGHYEGAGHQGGSARGAQGGSARGAQGGYRDRVPAPAGRGAHASQTSQGALAGSVFDRSGWGTFVQEMREKTVRRS